MKRADAVTLVGGSLAALAMGAAASGQPVLGARILVASYAADVLDGWVARRYGESSPEGQLLDRALDRFSQVVVPALLYLSYWLHRSPPIHWRALALLYVAIIVPYSFYRLAYRRVASREYFPGAPLFTHTLVLLGSVIGRIPVHPLVLLALAGLSIIPLKYYRRPPSSKESPALIPRLAGIAVAAAIPYNGLLGRILGLLLALAGLAYALLGWIPYYLAFQRSKKI